MKAMKKRNIVIFALAAVFALFLAAPQVYAQTEQGTNQPGYGYGMGPGMMGRGYGYGYGMGPGTNQPGYGYGMGPGMMGRGYGYGYGMGPGMMGPGYGYGMGPGTNQPGYGYGYGYGMGPGMMGPGYGQSYGGQYQEQKPVDKKEAKAILENYLASARNPNLKLGKIEDTGNAFVGDIVTAKSGVLVDKIAIDKKTAWMYPVR